MDFKNKLACRWNLFLPKLEMLYCWKRNIKETIFLFWYLARIKKINVIKIKEE